MSIWLLSIFGYIMLFYYSQTAFLTFFSQRNPYTNTWELLDILFKIVNDIKIFLPILIIFALIELGLKHYKNIGYDFDKPFINNPIIFFLFKLGFYLMFFPMTLVLTYTCVAIFINSFVLTLAWIMPGIIITIMIFWDIPIKTKFAKYGIASIFIIYTLIERLFCWLCYRY